MASLSVCVSCEDSFAGEPKGTCDTCGGGLCDLCFLVHEKGAVGKGTAKGHRFSRKDNASVTMALALLATAGLSPSMTRCLQHDEPVKLACTTCAEHAICVLCGVSRHTGHTLLVLSEAAPVARTLLRSAAEGLTSPGARTTVETVRSLAQRVAAELDALPGRISAAEQRIDSFRDSLIAAAVSRHAALRAVRSVWDALTTASPHLYISDLLCAGA